MKMKRIVSTLMALIMVLTLMPTALAADDDVAQIGEHTYATLADALAAVADAGTAVEIKLLADCDLSFGAWEAGGGYFGGEHTPSITIDGQDKTLNLHGTDTDYSTLGMVNPDGKLILKNMTVNYTTAGGGAWNAHALNFFCAVEMTDVTVNNAISVAKGATLNNVQINETGAYYCLWIKATEQTVNITGGSMTATNGGRGIKIADQYVSTDKGKVTLSVSGTTFETAKKSAILVSSTAGADITLSNVDISRVAADSSSAVWNDEDYADNYKNVTVTGGSVYLEGTVAKIGNVPYTSLAKAIAAASTGENKTIDLLGGTFDMTRNENRYTATVQRKGAIDVPDGVTFKNGTFVITGVTEQAGVFYVEKGTASFEDVTFRGNGYNSGAAVIWGEGSDTAPVTINLTRCTFDLSNEQSAAGGVLRGMTPSVVTYNVTGCQFNLKNTVRVFGNITLDMKNSSVNAEITDGTQDNGLRNVYGTIKNSTLSISNYEYGLKNNAALSLQLLEGSSVTLSGSREKDLYLDLTQTGLTVDGTSRLTYGTSQLLSGTDTIYYTLTLNANGGKLANSVVFVRAGDKVNLANYVPTRDKYNFTGWYSLATTEGGEDVLYSGEIELTGNLTLTAKWEAQQTGDNGNTGDGDNGSNSGSHSGGSSSGATRYAITVKAGRGGEVVASPARAVKGTIVTLTVTPDDGYVLDSLTVTDKKGQEVELTRKSSGVYTFKMPNGSVTVTADFDAEEAEFIDVPVNSYYHAAVQWAVENGITSGKTAHTFEPDGACTRAQAVTFLWRAAGCPAPKHTTMPFTDIPADAYYYDAVLWAVENDITTGVTDTTFAPYESCTRAQIVTFLFRSAAAMGMYAVTMQELVSGYADAAQVPGYALSAMNWALASGVVQGSDSGLMPNSLCTRAQIVTFLYRFYHA